MSGDCEKISGILYRFLLNNKYFNYLNNSIDNIYSLINLKDQSTFAEFSNFNGFNAKNTCHTNVNSSHSMRKENYGFDQC